MIPWEVRLPPSAQLFDFLRVIRYILMNIYFIFRDERRLYFIRYLSFEIYIKSLILSEPRGFSIFFIDPEFHQFLSTLDLLIFDLLKED